MNRINQIKESIVAQKEQAAKELYEAALKANTSSIQSLSNDIKIIDKLLKQFDANDQTTDKNHVAPHKKAIQRNNNEKKPESPVAESETTVLPITANLTNKRPLAIEMNGKTELTNSFRSLTEAACRLAYEKDRNSFAKLCENPNVNGDKHQYFASTSLGMSDPAMIGSGKNAIYVDVSKLAINNLYFLKKSLEELGYDLSAIKVSIDPNYSREPREKK